MRVRFLLICEGASDATLVAHKRLLIACGASEAELTSQARAFGMA